MVSLTRLKATGKASNSISAKVFTSITQLHSRFILKVGGTRNSKPNLLLDIRVLFGRAAFGQMPDRQMLGRHVRTKRKLFIISLGRWRNEQEAIVSHAALNPHNGGLPRIS